MSISSATTGKNFVWIDQYFSELWRTEQGRHVSWNIVYKQITKLLCPNSITPIFTETFPRGKSWTQITKVADTNHLDMSRCLRQSPWQVRDKPVCVAL